MKLVYVAGPYRDKRGAWFIQQNIRNAETIALELWRQGFAVICPHKNTAFFDGAGHDSIWLEGDLVMLRRCDAVVTTPAWMDSTGARREVLEAHMRGIPVYSWPESALTLANIASQDRCAELNQSRMPDEEAPRCRR